MTRSPSLPPAFLRAPIAHRGLHDADQGVPENSRAAFKAAIAGGYGIELDLQMSSDGTAMVFHDYDLSRLTGADGKLRDRTATELSRIQLLTNGEGIPTLAEVLTLVAGRAPLLIEIKDQDGAMGPDTGQLEAATAHDLQGYQGPVALMSFNPHSVAAVATAAPDIPRGLTTCAYDPADWPELTVETCDHLRAIPDYDRTGSCFISHQGNDLRNPRVAELKAGGAAILCWTIRSPEQEAAARTVADNVTFEGYAAKPSGA